MRAHLSGKDGYVAAVLPRLPGHHVPSRSLGGPPRPTPTRTPVQRRLTTAHRSALLRDALAVMERDYAQPLQLEDVARRIATSRRQLQRCFAEHGDGSFRECLTGLRMAHAAELLRGGSTSVKAVAAMVGYRQPAQFAKAFRRRYGVSPTTYRAQHAGDGGRRRVPPGDDAGAGWSAAASAGATLRARTAGVPLWSPAR